MPSRRTAIRLMEDDYDAFLAIVRPDEKLPSSYRAWLGRTFAENKSKIGAGDTLHEVTVKPEGFLAYCKASGLEPTYFALETYAMEQLLREEDPDQKVH